MTSQPTNQKRAKIDVMVRTAHVDDLPMLSEFAGASYRDAYREFDDADEINVYVAENFSLHRLQQLHAQPDSHFLLAHRALTGSSQLLGYAHTRLGRPEIELGAQRPMQLVRLYLDPTQKGLGIGSVLMRAVLELAEASACEAIWLGVYSRNRTALAFYHRWGFTQVGLTEFVFAGRSYMDPLLKLKLR